MEGELASATQALRDNAAYGRGIGAGAGADDVRVPCDAVPSDGEVHALRRRLRRARARHP